MEQPPERIRRRCKRLPATRRERRRIDRDEEDAEIGREDIFEAMHDLGRLTRCASGRRPGWAPSASLEAQIIAHRRLAFFPLLASSAPQNNRQKRSGRDPETFPRGLTGLAPVFDGSAFALRTARRWPQRLCRVPSFYSALCIAAVALALAGVVDPDRVVHADGRRLHAERCRRSARAAAGSHAERRQPGCRSLLRRCLFAARAEHASAERIRVADPARGAVTRCGRPRRDGPLGHSPELRRSAVERR